jgi:hypothetical protein
MRASSRRSLNSLPAHAFSSAANSSSVITGTGFIFKVVGDRVLIGFSGSSSSSTRSRNGAARGIGPSLCRVRGCH